MAKKIGGLGKGLSAIFVENETEDKNEVVNLKISQIEPNRDQPRREFDEQALEELSLSIGEYGVLQPITVRPLLSGGYQIVAGERRYRASMLAGLTEIPAIIRDLSDREMLEIALIENLQREDLQPLEEARGYKMLADEYDMGHADIADAVGKSRSAVTNALRLLSLPTEVVDLLEEGEITAGHARALLGLKDKGQMANTAELVAEEELSVRETEELVRKLSEEKKPQKEKKERKKSNFFTEVELSLSEEFGTKVSVLPGKKKGSGKLCIEFYDEQELVKLSAKLEKLWNSRS